MSYNKEYYELNKMKWVTYRENQRKPVFCHCCAKFIAKKSLPTHKQTNEHKNNRHREAGYKHLENQLFEAYGDIDKARYTLVCMHRANETRHNNKADPHHRRCVRRIARLKKLCAKYEIDFDLIWD